MSEASMSERNRINAFVDSHRFQNAIFVIIVFNAIILGLETSQWAMSKAGTLISLLDNACLAIFVFEITLKLYARRLDFFRNGWSIFDLIIVGVALVPGSSGFSVLRALRILRVLRVISVAPRLRRVVEGFITALPGMASVFLLIRIAMAVIHVQGIGKPSGGVRSIVFTVGWAISIILAVLAIIAAF